VSTRWFGLAVLAVLLSSALAVGYSWVVVDARLYGEDFAGTLWRPGQAVIEGTTPYPDESPFGSPSVYPPPVILAFIPLALLPLDIASASMAVLMIAAAMTTLLVLGVRDWFVHAAVLSSFAVLSASSWGNSSPLMILLVALVWRDRTRSWLWLACAILVKLWMAPLLAWLAFTRPRQAALSALTLGIALVAGWAAIGGDGLLDYPARLDAVVDAHARNGMFVYALALQLVGSSTLAWVASLALTGALLVVSHALDERRMFQLLLVACLIASPIVWPMYLGLLVIVIGVSERRHQRTLWLALPATWMFILSPAGAPRPLWLVLSGVVLVAVVTWTALDTRMRPSLWRPLSERG
jgi:hypothetical protein